MQDREHEPQVGATGVCRASSDWTPSWIAKYCVVDVVVEGDHLVGELES